MDLTARILVPGCCFVTRKEVFTGPPWVGAQTIVANPGAEQSSNWIKRASSPCYTVSWEDRMVGTSPLVLFEIHAATCTAQPRAAVNRIWEPFTRFPNQAKSLCFTVSKASPTDRRRRISFSLLTIRFLG